ncbi:MAG: hypothetical protein AAF747_08575 [Planctomycetota bacterium]
MVPNGSISSIRNVSGARGDGEKTYEGNSITVTIPCRIDEPSSFARTDAAQRGIELDSMLVVSRFAIAGADAEIKQGTLIEASSPVGDANGEVVELRARNNDLVEVRIGQKVSA